MRKSQEKPQVVKYRGKHLNKETERFEDPEEKDQFHKCQ